MVGLKKGQGFTLIEVLVAMGILSLGILGTASLQAKALRYVHMADSQSSAVLLSRDLVGRMRANASDPAILAMYGHEGGGDTPEPERNCNVQSCSGEQLVAYDLSLWLGEVNRTWKSVSTSLLAIPEPETGFFLLIRWGSEGKGEGKSEGKSEGSCTPPIHRIGNSGCWQTRVMF